MAKFKPNYFKERAINNLDEGVEVELYQFQKSKKGYMINLFFGVSSLKYLLFPLMGGILLLFYFLSFNKDSSFLICIISFLGLGLFCWICQICIGLFKWKYNKYIVVTNQGIWISRFGSYYEGFIFDGKPRKYGLRWFIYDWIELSDVQMFTDRISRGLKLKNFKMDRWDGIEKVYYLKQEDVEKILECAKTYIKKKKKKKEKVERTGQLKFFHDLTKFFTGEDDEERY